MSKHNIYDSLFSERIKLISEEFFKGNISKFAKTIGVSQPSLTKWLNYGTDISRSNLIKIIEATGTNPEWLILGKGQMKTQSNSPNANDSVVMIPSYSYIDVSVTVKHFDKSIQPDSEEPYSIKCLERLGAEARNLAVFWASDNSMQPTIEEADKLLIDLSVKEIKNDRIYLIQNGSSMWIKRIRFLWDSVEIVSDNKSKYAPITISPQEAKELKILGQVIHISKCVL